MSFFEEKKTKQTKKEKEKAYQEFIDDPATFAIDEILGILGPHYESKRV